jgi:hypothetical protein
MVSEGYCRCITCGRINHILKCHCGHFMPRTKLGTRFNEQNCHAQCVYCNSFKEGEHYAYGQILNAKYGKGTADKLYAASKGISKLDAFYYEKMIDFYYQKCIEMGGKNYWTKKVDWQ